MRLKKHKFKERKKNKIHPSRSIQGGEGENKKKNGFWRQTEGSFDAYTAPSRRGSQYLLNATVEGGVW
jgi:hypothetical protein